MRWPASAITAPSSAAVGRSQGHDSEPTWTLSATPPGGHGMPGALAQARSIGQVLDGLPASLTDAQRAAAETALVARAVGRTAEQLTTVAADVLAEVAPAAVSSEA